MVICGHLGSLQRSLRGRRLKGKGKGVLDARETRGAREEGGRETSLPPSPPFPPRASLAFCVSRFSLSLPFQAPATQATSPAGVFRGARFSSLPTFICGEG